MSHSGPVPPTTFLARAGIKSQSMAAGRPADHPPVTASDKERGNVSRTAKAVPALRATRGFQRQDYIQLQPLIPFHSLAAQARLETPDDRWWQWPAQICCR